MAPDPVELVGKLKPENSSVCEVARLVILISEEKVLADDGDDIVKDDAVVLVVEATSFVLFLKFTTSVLRSFKSDTTVAKSDIAIFCFSIFLSIRSLLGAVSALTILSTICFIFKPEPPVFRALK